MRTHFAVVVRRVRVPKPRHVRHVVAYEHVLVAPAVRTVGVQRKPLLAISTAGLAANLVVHPGEEILVDVGALVSHVLQPQLCQLAVGVRFVVPSNCACDGRATPIPVSPD